MEAHLFQLIEQDDGVFKAETQISVIDELLNAFLLEKTVDVRKFRRQVGIENDAPNGGLNELALHLYRDRVRHIRVVVRGGEVDDFTAVAQTDGREQCDFAGFQREDNFIGGAENAAFALGSGLVLGQIVDAEDHVLRRHGKRQAVGRRKNVARAEHEHGRFNLRFGRKRDVHGHLVAVKVRVERGADERVDADGFAFNENRFERLNADTVKRRGAVEHHGMFADNVFQDVPNDGFLLLDHFLGLLDGGAMALSFELVIDERLEELERHLLGQTALVELEFRADDDNGAAGPVHTLSAQVSAATACPSLER